MRIEIVKAVLVSLLICAFILWLAATGELQESLVVVFIVAFAIVLPLIVLLLRLGRLR